MPKTKSKKYKSALELIKENVIHFSDSEDEDIHDNTKHKELSKFEKLADKIQKKQAKKTKRDTKFRSIDWQKKRLPDIARKINSLYIRDNKSVLKLEVLRKYVDTNTFESDLKRLGKTSRRRKNGILGTLSITLRNPPYPPLKELGTSYF